MYKRLMDNDEVRNTAVTGLSNLGLGFVKGWQRNHKQELSDIRRMTPKQGAPLDHPENQDQDQEEETNQDQE